MNQPGYIPDDQIFPRWEKALRLLWFGVPILFAGAGWYAWNRNREPSTVVRRPTIEQVTKDPGLTTSPAVSRDGKWLAFTSDREKEGALSLWVSRLPGGVPRRISPLGWETSQPDFSPDGQSVVFRSASDGAIYIIPSVGGAPRKAAMSGWRPRYSPDGKWIAYYDTTSVEHPRLFVVAAGGGEAKELRADFRSASLPVWVSATHLVLEGADRERMADWWVTPLDDGPAARLFAFDAIRAEVTDRGAPERWRDGGLLFSGSPGEYVHVWELPVDPVDWRVTGKPRQLTEGAGIETSPALGPDGALYYAALQTAVEVWGLDADANAAKAHGPPKQITSEGGAAIRLPQLSADGTKLTYILNRAGRDDLKLKNLSTGKEDVITSIRRLGYRPILAAAGDKIAIPASKGSDCAIAILALDGRISHSIKSPCVSLWDWSPNEQDFLALDHRNPFKQIDVVNAAGSRTLLKHGSQRLFAARYSPDGRWVAFAAGPSSADAQVYIAPVRNGTVTDGEWIKIPEAPGGSTAWSPDGSMLYIQSMRDGYLCLWAQPLSSSKRPVGDPIAVQHYHNAIAGIGALQNSSFQLSVARNRIAWNGFKSSGNIWRTRLVR